MNNSIQQMNILFCCDTNYAMPLTVSITSIFQNNIESHITVYVLYSSLSTIQINKLNELSIFFKQKIELIKVNENYFNTAPVLRWSKETYYRLLLTELLPNTIDKILYLDCDIIVNKPLNELFSLDFEGSSILALKESNSESPRKRLGLNPEGNYFQAGVLLFDVNKCRDSLNYENSISIINKLGDKLEVVDQDVINVMFDGKIKSFSKKFNNCEITNFNENNFNRFRNHIDKATLDETVILHYATGKPWNNLYAGSCEEIWYSYLKSSPYSELYTKKYNTLKYKLFRTGLFKILFYEYIHITPTVNKLAQQLFPNNTYIKLKNWYRKNIK